MLQWLKKKNPNLYLIYQFQMACSTIRYGKAVTQEVGMDLVNFNAKKVCVMTDPNLSKLPAVSAVLDSVTRNNVPYELYDKVTVEPTGER